MKEPRTGLNADGLISATHDMRKVPQAKALVERAFAEIDKGYPSIAKEDEARRLRADRLRERIPTSTRDWITSVVAQWLSAREAPAAAPDARKAAKTVSDLLKQITEAHKSLAALSEALRFSDTTDQGHDAQGLAQVVASSLLGAMQSLGHAEEWAEELVDLIPAGAKGQRGVVGALCNHGANDALAISLGRSWIDRGLKLDGGKNGDGFDVFVESIIGNRKEAEKALAAARREFVDLQLNR
jgi:hypothetical protein